MWWNSPAPAVVFIQQYVRRMVIINSFGKHDVLGRMIKLVRSLFHYFFRRFVRVVFSERCLELNVVEQSRACHFSFINSIVEWFIHSLAIQWKDSLNCKSNHDFLNPVYSLFFLFATVVWGGPGGAVQRHCSQLFVRRMTYSFVCNAFINSFVEWRIHSFAIHWIHSITYSSNRENNSVFSLHEAVVWAGCGGKVPRLPFHSLLRPANDY